jgi:Bacterial PH domain
MKHIAPLDNFAKNTTLIISVLLITIVWGLLILAQNNFVVSTIIIVFLVGVYCIAFAYKPTNYTITNETIVINRLINNVVIEKKSILTVELLGNKQLKCSVRAFASGGIFGYFGKFAYGTLGTMDWYATNKNNLVLITMINNKKIVVSPNNPQEFVVNF